MFLGQVKMRQVRVLNPQQLVHTNQPTQPCIPEHRNTGVLERHKNTQEKNPLYIYIYIYIFFFFYIFLIVLLDFVVLSLHISAYLYKVSPPFTISIKYPTFHPLSKSPPFLGVKTPPLYIPYFWSILVFYTPIP